MVFVLLLHVVELYGICTAACCGVVFVLLHAVEWYLYCCMLWTGVIFVLLHAVEWYLYCCDGVLLHALVITDIYCCMLSSVVLPVESTHFNCCN